MLKKLHIQWSSIIPPDELTNIPTRDAPEYLGFCEKIISELTAKVESTKANDKVTSAENTIVDLMAELHISDSKHHASGKGVRRPSGSVFGGDLTTNPIRSPGHDLSFTHHPPFLCQVIEESDGKEYISKLRPESHLVPSKTYEQMNYRDLVLGMAGVRSHLVFNYRLVMGYDSHCLFVKRKSTTFLYTNMASILYDRFVTDRVISGEYADFPSSCSDASLEFYCDSCRRENGAHSVGGGQPSQSPGTGKKPWSGYPYPYCFFGNEMQMCSKRNCGLKHECGYCHVSEHKSKDCQHSTWKKSTSSDHVSPIKSAH